MLKEKKELMLLKQYKYIDAILNINLINFNVIPFLKKNVIMFILMRNEEDYFVYGNIFFYKKNFIIYNKKDNSSLYFYYFSPFIYNILLF